ncbi:MAG TPA: YcfL family protein [Thiopseudomonas sp.]|nr:YcfL family protein [Thiopseudomonas sp.]
MHLSKLLVGCAAALLLSACAPSLIHVNKSGVTAQSEFPEYVTDIRRRVNDNGLLEVQIVLQSSKSRTINYKIEWLDHQGYTLRNPIDERYRQLRLVRNEEYVLSKLASDKRAQDIKVYIK